MHSQYQATMMRQQGFSLIELMIVVVIIGILASISYPSYRDSVRRSNRTEGKALLVDAANRQERFFSNNNSYTIDMTQLGYIPVVPATPQFTYSENKYYVMSAAPLAVASGGSGNIATSYQLRVAIIAGQGQADDSQCAFIYIDSLGRKTAVDGGGNDTSSTCW